MEGMVPEAECEDAYDQIQVQSFNVELFVAYAHSFVRRRTIPSPALFTRMQK